MTIEQLVDKILEHMGSKSNVITATNCMTRLRINVKDDSSVNEEALKALEDVMGIVHDRANYWEVVVGPGKCRKCADRCKDLGIPAAADGEMTTGGDWKANKAAVKAGQKDNRVKSMLKTFGDIFVPLIPGVIAAGLCAGLNTLIQQVFKGSAEAGWYIIVTSLLGLINTAFMTYLTAWAGYRAAEKFGGTPVLGGMLGMITTLGGIDAISKVVHLYNEAQPLDAILRAGRGGVLAAVIGVYFMCKIERAIRAKMPDSLDIVFTPVLTLLITLVPYILIVMPITGLISTALVKLVGAVALSESAIVRAISGYLGAALFLPMVAMGMHHGLVALYTVQLETFGAVFRYPALAMAGAGQVGAALAIYLKCKKCGNKRLQSVIGGALPAGILGVGEPL
ncbi:MAG: PTS transporter subunit EIIC, partial [Oscillospiraceae bacterium]|nr:PTS transporter subunit EIIC [Oscillospiraceae bacterium]